MPCILLITLTKKHSANVVGAVYLPYIPLKILFVGSSNLLLLPLKCFIQQHGDSVACRGKKKWRGTVRGEEMFIVCPLIMAQIVNSAFFFFFYPF